MLATEARIASAPDSAAVVATGTVTLVGAGPGDPELLTLKAARALAAADVVVYDYLANPALLRHCRAGVRTEFVGKRAGHHSCSQADINARLVALAREGLAVVRLKGGDPFVFGRGGEEQVALCAAGVRCEIVPGITAGIAAPAAVGIPVTDRDRCTGVTFLTGHAQAGGEDRNDYAALAATGATLVLYMAVGRMARIARELVAGGKDPATPVAIVRRGTWATQDAWRSDLAGVADLIAREDITPPAVVVVGAVVELGAIPV